MRKKLLRVSLATIIALALVGLSRTALAGCDNWFCSDNVPKVYSEETDYTIMLDSVSPTQGGFYNYAFTIIVDVDSQDVDLRDILEARPFDIYVADKAEDYNTSTNKAPGVLLEGYECTDGLTERADSAIRCSFSVAGDVNLLENKAVFILRFGFEKGSLPEHNKATIWYSPKFLLSECNAINSEFSCNPLVSDICAQCDADFSVADNMDVVESSAIPQLRLKKAVRNVFSWNKVTLKYAVESDFDWPDGVAAPDQFAVLIRKVGSDGFKQSSIIRSLSCDVDGMKLTCDVGVRLTKGTQDGYEMKMVAFNDEVYWSSSHENLAACENACGNGDGFLVLDGDAICTRDVRNPVSADLVLQAVVVNGGLDIGTWLSVYADTDGDGVIDSLDKCEGYNDNLNADADDWPDDCDNCVNKKNNNQHDMDGDGIGDKCDDDIDGDDIDNDVDNCDYVPNPGQENVCGSPSIPQPSGSGGGTETTADPSSDADDGGILLPPSVIIGGDSSLGSTDTDAPGSGADSGAGGCGCSVGGDTPPPSQLAIMLGLGLFGLAALITMRRRCGA